jgi:hypothetical protein
MAGDRDGRPRGDVEIGAAASAKRLRFRGRLDRHRPRGGPDYLFSTPMRSSRPSIVAGSPSVPSVSSDVASVSAET